MISVPTIQATDTNARQSGVTSLTTAIATHNASSTDDRTAMRASAMKVSTVMAARARNQVSHRSAFRRTLFRVRLCRFCEVLIIYSESRSAYITVSTEFVLYNICRGLY